MPFYICEEKTVKHDWVIFTKTPPSHFAAPKQVESASMMMRSTALRFEFKSKGRDIRMLDFLSYDNVEQQNAL